MSSLRNVSPAWPRAICRHCGGHVTISSCALKNCRIWELESLICGKLANSPWKRRPLSEQFACLAATNNRALTFEHWLWLIREQEFPTAFRDFMKRRSIDNLCQMAHIIGVGQHVAARRL